jgi:uncharacterized protein
MFKRDMASHLKALAKQYPVLTLTGPRQSGKTTLCKTLFARHAYVSLEDPDVRRFAAEDPRGFLGQFAKGAVLDEIQRAPELLSYIQTIVDKTPGKSGQFILTGSHQFELMRGVSQSLAGRTAIAKLLPLSLHEVGGHSDLPKLPELLLRGFYPRIWAAALNPSGALADYFSTYVARDLRELSAVHDLQRFERFVRLCAGRVGQIVNLSSLGNDAGITHTTARAWLDLLQTSYVVFLLPPWFSNTNKRLIKSPKLYFYDVGLAAWLLNLRTPAHVGRDPALGHLFENLVVMDVLKQRFNRGETAELYFYRDAIGNEVDLLAPNGRQFDAFEMKAGATINSDFFRGFDTFEKSFSGVLASGTVIYGGQAAQSRGRWQARGWQSLSI